MFSANHIVVIIIFIIVFLFYSWNQTENFSTYYGRQCNSCSNKSFGQCLQCNDCGICFDGETYKCIKGDSFGPHINDKYRVTCQRWYSNDPMARYVNENNFCLERPFANNL